MVGGALLVLYPTVIEDEFGGAGSLVGFMQALIDLLSCHLAKKSRAAPSAAAGTERAASPAPSDLRNALRLGIFFSFLVYGRAVIKA